MRNPFGNLRLPGRRQRRYNPRGVSGRAMSSRAPQRQYTLARAERPKPPREFHVPWRRIGVALGGLVAASSVIYGAAWLLTGDSLRVMNIDVSGAQVVGARQVAAVSQLGGESMLTLDTTKAEQEIALLPAVKSVTVERAWPNSVHVTIEEHQAWGYWQTAGRVQVIDADGNVLRASRPAPEDAPTIIDLASPRDLEDGKGADPDTVHLVARLIEDRVFQEAGLTPTAWVFQRDRGLTVIAQDGPDAVFGDSSNYEFKVEAFEQVLRQLSEREATGSPQVAEVDLRFGRNVVLR
ncbi:MAG: FtsQ-type POTRA domain-containing protein [Dehalococcoidia bacterium]|nr:FtsQ-type POTRA domain-containing protein [Dehalococcoidia bacterium]MCB9491735.1 FtsQ-type POTRA domain-containing protein [Dehalococcoidia bacterium]